MLNGVNEQELVEIPLALYCDLKGIDRRTALNRCNRKELEMVKKGNKNYVLIKKDSIFILSSTELYKKSIEEFKSIQRRRSKKLVQKLKDVQKSLNAIVNFLDKGENNE